LRLERIEPSLGASATSNLDWKDQPTGKIMPLEEIEQVQKQVNFVGEVLLGRPNFQIYLRHLHDREPLLVL
jgi:hypothetical protein